MGLRGWRAGRLNPASARCPGPSQHLELRISKAAGTEPIPFDVGSPGAFSHGSTPLSRNAAFFFGENLC